MNMPVQLEHTQVCPLLQVYPEDAIPIHAGHDGLHSMTICFGTRTQTLSPVASDEISYLCLILVPRNGSIPLIMEACVQGTRSRTITLGSFPSGGIQTADLRRAFSAWPRAQRSPLIRPTGSVYLRGRPQGCAQGTNIYRTVLLFLTAPLVSEDIVMRTCNSDNEVGTDYVGDEEDDEEPTGESRNTYRTHRVET
jgi:hypothetical protein